MRARLQDLEHEGGGGEAERRADDEGLEIINLQNYKIIKLFWALYKHKGGLNAAPMTRAWTVAVLIILKKKKKVQTTTKIYIYKIILSII